MFDIMIWAPFSPAVFGNSQRRFELPSQDGWQILATP